jgi:hypothetical protein
MDQLQLQNLCNQINIFHFENNETSAPTIEEHELINKYIFNKRFIFSLSCNNCGVGKNFGVKMVVKNFFFFFANFFFFFLK